MQADHIMLCESSAACQIHLAREGADFIETMLATELPVDENVRAGFGVG